MHITTIQIRWQHLGLIIFNSCCHGGVGNIINEVAMTFPTEKVYGIIGGFHLFNKSDEEIENVIQQLKDTVLNIFVQDIVPKAVCIKCLKAVLVTSYIN